MFTFLSYTSKVYQQYTFDASGQLSSCPAIHTETTVLQALLWHTVFLVFLSSWQLWLLTGDLQRTGPTNLRVTGGPQPQTPGEAQVTAGISRGLPQGTAACKLFMLPQLTWTSSLACQPRLGCNCLGLFLVCSLQRTDVCLPRKGLRKYAHVCMVVNVTNELSLHLNDTPWSGQSHLSFVTNV